jgi:glyoxylase-like metal-dependent hydrolase (beta-lactamase superfamily II)
MTTQTVARDLLKSTAGHGAEVVPDVAMVQTVLVNLFLVGEPGSDHWVLVDAGIPGFATRIARAARARFGDAPPQCVILTHGHFDHVGSLDAVLNRWDVPVYAHELELPYVDGRSDYPPPDPTVGGGVMARSAPLFPRHGYDFRPNIRALPGDGSVPGLDGWRWIHTPGHAPGHVSLFRESDGTLIAGDAFTTQKQESFWGVMTNYREIHGPPKYFTTDWDAARESVEKLYNLRPTATGTGHGLPLRGEQLAGALHDLVFNWRDIAQPKDGRYVRHPVVAGSNGPTYVPPRVPDPFPWVMGAVAIGAAAAVYGGKKYLETRHEKDWLDD